MLANNLTNLEMYGYYATCIQSGNWEITVSDITIKNLDSHINGLINILKDSIELEELHRIFIKINFNNSISINLTITDYLINLIMWRAILSTGQSLQPKHIFFEENLTRKGIKSYIDKFLILPNRKTLSNKRLNNIINETLSIFKFIKDFAMYLSNTINMEDDIRLMNEYPEAYNAFHLDVSNIPLEDVKAVGSKTADDLVKLIKNTPWHALSDFFRSGEGINQKQYKEYCVNIGTKPDGNGGVYPAAINSSFVVGGLDNLLSLFIESGAGRTAQILSKTNVGDSGHFARLLGLNNSDTILHHDKDYVCNSKNYTELPIKTQMFLEKFHGMWYRLSPNGMDMQIDKNNSSLVGRTILLRSPITCASKSRGEGICYRCYGDLAYVNNDINVGKIAAELLSAVLTQKLLSAKHLLESLIQRIDWVGEFNTYFNLDANVVVLRDDVDTSNMKIYIDPANITPESEDDDFEYNEYINEFTISIKGNNIPIYNKDRDNLYISCELNELIRECGVAVDGLIEISLKNLQEIPLFLVKIHNNAISETLKRLTNIVNNSGAILHHDRHTIVEAFIDTVLEGQLDLTAIHGLTILSNQIRSKEHALFEPDWTIPNVDYRLLTLNQALTEHPSIIVSLNYQNLSRMLYNPLTYKKHKASFMDLFFIPTPQNYVNKQ